jgi:hypothetical protein
VRVLPTKVMSGNSVIIVKNATNRLLVLKNWSNSRKLRKIFVGFWIFFFFHEWPLSVTSSWKLFLGAEDWQQ